MSESAGSSGGRFSILAIPLALLGASLAVRAATFFRRGFINDDYYFAYFGWIRSTDLIAGRDFYVPSPNAIIELFVPLFRVYPESFAPVMAARAFLLLVSFALLYAVYRLSAALGASRLWGVTVTAFVSCQSTFMQRITDLRGDAVAATFLLASAIAIAEASGLAAALVAGFAAGCAVVFSLKLVYALPFLLAGAVLALPRQRLAALVAFGGGSSIAPLVYALWRMADDGLAPFLEQLRMVFVMVRIGQSNEVSLSFAALQSEWHFWLLMLASIAGGAAAWRRGERRIAVYGVLVAGFLAVFFLRNPWVYSYTALILVPVTAPMLLGLRIPRFEAIAILVVCAVMAAGAVPAARTIARQQNDEQIELIRWLWDATAPDEGVFDWTGMHFGRRGPHHWSIFSGTANLYMSGTWYRLAPELVASRVTTIFPNKKFAWVRPDDRRFISSHYLVTSPCSLTLGSLLRQQSLERGDAAFHIAIPARYEVSPPGAPIAIDGKPVTGAVALGPGMHTAVATGKVKGPVAILFTSERRRAAGPPPCPPAIGFPY